MIPTMVPHSGLERSKGTAPLCEDGGKRHAGQRRRSLGSPGCNAVAVPPDLDNYIEGFIVAPSGCSATIRMRNVLPHARMFPNSRSLPHVKCSLLHLEHDGYSGLTGWRGAEP